MQGAGKRIFHAGENPRYSFIKTIMSEKLAEEIMKTYASQSNYSETRKIIEAKYSWGSKAEDLERIYANL